MLLLALVLAASLTEARNSTKHVRVIKPQAMQRALTSKSQLRSAEECRLCASFMDDFLNALLNAILQGGVLGSCSALCGMINGNEIEEAVCNLLCDYVGLDAFIAAINYADLDPVWMCEEIYFCAKTTCTSRCASIGSTIAEPLNLPAGNQITFTTQFTIGQGVGVSSIGLVLTNLHPDSNGNYFQDLEVGILWEPTPGGYRVQFPVTTSDSDGMGDTFPWPTGPYNTTVIFCEGMCGSDHTGSGEILAQAAGPNFTLTM